MSSTIVDRFCIPRTKIAHKFGSIVCGVTVNSRFVPRLAAAVSSTAPYGDCIHFSADWAIMSDNGADAPRSANLLRGGARSPPASSTQQAKDLQKLELSFIELNKEKARQREEREWKKLIRDLVFQRGKIPLLLAVEAGNQSMVRELLSAQTAEQLKVDYITITPKYFFSTIVICVQFIQLFAHCAFRCCFSKMLI